MAENVVIRIREDGSLKVVRNFKDIGDSARRAEGGVNILRRTLGLLGGVLAVRSVIQYSDAYTQLQNRLRLVTKSSSELRVVTDELRKVANDTRTSFQGTAEFYARAGLAAKNLGVSQQQLLDLTRSVNQAIILSGATGVEAEKGLIQFAQGLGSGSLQGDELRSVLEQLPLVADVIAKQLGVTRNELRKLASQGKLTSQVILEAFKNSREELDQAFRNTTPTIQQSLSVLRNEILVFIGRFNEGTGAANLFSRAILILAQNVDTFVRIITAGGIAVAIQSITNGVRGLFALIASNPIGLIVTGITLAAGALVAFSDKIGVAHDGLVSLQDFAIGFAEAFQESFFGDQFRRGLSQIQADLEKVFSGINLSFRGIVTFAARVADAILGIIEGIVLAIREGTFVIGSAIAFLLRGQFDSAKNAAESLGGTIKDAFLTGLARDDVQLFVSEVFDNAAAAAAERLGKRSAQLREPAVDLTKAGEARQLPPTGGGKAPRLTVGDVIADLEREGRLLQLNNREREREAQSLQIIDALVRARAKFDLADIAQIDKLIARNQLLEDQANLYEEIKGPQEDYAVQVEALNVLFDAGRISIDEFNNKLAELNRKVLETDNSFRGAGKGLLAGFIQPAQSLFLSLEQTGIGTLQSFGDALSETFRRGGNIGDFFESFKAGLSDTLGQLAQLTFRLLLIQSITALGGGNFLASIGVSSARAFGGTTQGGREGRVMRVGERGPENVFVGPGQQAAVQPVQPQAPPQVTVIAVADPGDVPAFLNSTEGGQVIVQSVSRNRTQIRAALGI